MKRILKVKIHPKTSQQKIEIIKNTHEVWVKSPAERNKANLEMIELLAKYFDVSKSQIEIIQGLTSRNKIIVINEI